MRVAVDILGGDHAPREILLGVAQAISSGEFAPGELLLVGPGEAASRVLGEAGLSELPEVLETTAVVEGHESPIEALRRKPGASISRCVEAVRDGRAGGLLSFGNTGASVAAATLGLRLLPGVRRPAIAVSFNGEAGRFVLLDAGANPTPKPQHLFQYGLIGDAYARGILGITRPRVGLLNIGGEAGKGSPVAKEAYRMLREADLDFNGNIEGHDLFGGRADVLITDGVVGNMVLKVVEGFAGFLLQEVSKIGGRASLKEAIGRLTGASDYSEVGGATLLGVKGVVIIGHGRSTARAVLPALRAVAREIEQGVTSRISQNLARCAAAGGAPAGEAD